MLRAGVSKRGHGSSSKGIEVRTRRRVEAGPSRSGLSGVIHEQKFVYNRGMVLIDLGLKYVFVFSSRRDCQGRVILNELNEYDYLALATCW